MKWRRRLRQLLVLLSSLAALGFAIGFSKSYYSPRVKTWLLVMIEEQSQKHLPVRVWPKDLAFDIWRLELDLFEVRLLPQKLTEPQLSQSTIQHLKIKLNGWALLRGRLLFSKVSLSDAKIALLFSGQAPAPDPSGIPPWQLIEEIPIERLNLEKLDLLFRLKQQGISGSINQLSVDFEKQPGSLSLAVNSPAIELKKTNHSPRVRMALSATGWIGPEQAFLTRLIARQQNSFLLAVGSIDGNVLSGEWQQAQWNLRTQFELTELHPLLAKFIPEQRLPELEGKIKAEVAGSAKPDGKPRIGVRMNTEGLKVAGYSIDAIDLDATYLQNNWSFRKAAIHQAAGRLRLEQIKITSFTPFVFETRLEIDELDLHSLLIALKVKGVPVDLPLRATLPCRGQIADKWKIDCTAQIFGDYLRVRPSRQTENNIVLIQKPTIEGQVTVTERDVSYSGSLSFASSQGTSKGVIDFAKGFEISYEGTRVRFADFGKISGLKLEGNAQIKGTTSGDSQSATMDMQVNGDNLWFEDYQLGDATFQARYRQSILSFNRLQGRLGTSRYQGQVAVNLKQNRLAIDAKIPSLEAKHLARAFERKVNLPFAIQGSGSAEVHASGPFALGEMTYTLDAQIRQGQIAGESFDVLNFSVAAENGLVEARQVFLKKGPSNIILTGTVTPTGETDLAIRGRGFRLEQSENFSQTNLNMAGTVNFDSTLTGPILDPIVRIDGVIGSLLVNDLPTEESRFRLLIDREGLDAALTLPKDVARVELEYPFIAQRPFAFHLKTLNWEFTQFFSLFSQSSLAGSFRTAMTSEWHLQSPTGRLADLSGKVRVDNFLIQRGSVQMASRGPMDLTIESGTVTAKDWAIFGAGDNTFLALRAPGSRRGDVGVEIDGKIDMSLLALATPFLDEIGGNLELTLKISGPIDKTRWLGSAYVKNGNVRLPGFPHPVTNIYADVLFGQEQILLNSLRSELGGGRMMASGTVKIDGLRSFPTRIQMRLEQTNLQVPESFRSQGSGDLLLTGSWFPFTLGGRYVIERGELKQSIGILPVGRQPIQPSQLLPDFLLREAFHPLVLDLNVDIPRDIPVELRLTGVEIKTPVSGQVHLTGPTSTPTLTGRFTTGRSGLVTFRSNRFEIRSGDIEYRRSAPQNPRLLVNAESRVGGYDVNLLVQGTATAPLVSLTSQPPLEESKIVSLLALGFISDEDAASGATSGRYQVGSDLIADQIGLGQEIRDRFGVDVDFTSTFGGAETEAEHRVTVRKQISPRLGATASRLIGPKSGNDVKLEYRLGRDLSVIGSWQKGDETPSTPDQSESSFGLDLEYRREFK